MKIGLECAQVIESFGPGTFELSSRCFRKRLMKSEDTLHFSELTDVPVWDRPSPPESTGQTFVPVPSGPSNKPPHP